MFIGAQEWSLYESHGSLPVNAGELGWPQCHTSGTNGLSALYERLLNQPLAEDTRAQAATFLRSQIAAINTQACELPEAAHQLEEWMRATAQNTRARYSAYLAERNTGAPRLYFSNRSHGLYFLRAAAPTKLVDGAWLYGLASAWRNPRLAHLVRTYLEELGEGAPDKNHVLIYRQLLRRYGIDSLDNLAESLYTQGLIQLALAYNAEEFLPEIVGFNLGYEQLPLHLLITAYELNELGLDPYYFTLHITADNTDSGHAGRAVQAVMDILPKFGDVNAFWRRVRIGCLLGNAGVSTCAIIDSFDIEREVVRIFSNKSVAGHGVHSDYCRVSGRSVNEWLAQPSEVPGFLAALQKTGWIKRGESVENSRFWGLLQGQRAEMFGVFSPYELQVIHDWILGEASSSGTSYNTMAPATDIPRRPSFRVSTRLAERTGSTPIDRHPASDFFDPDLQAMLHELSQLDVAGQLKLLVNAMSPALHWTPAGLHATRHFCQQTA